MYVKSYKFLCKCEIFWSDLSSEIFKQTVCDHQTRYSILLLYIQYFCTKMLIFKHYLMQNVQPWIIMSEIIIL